MTFRLRFRTLLAMCLGSCVLLSACGKKAETKDDGPKESSRLPQTEIDSYLEKQSVSCEGSQACPAYITKIVIVHGQSYKFCTGFMVDDKTVATSASCLPGLLRLSGTDCSRDVFFFFPKASLRPAERASCSKVSLVSHLDGQDPILWRDDVAFLEMKESLPYRRKASIVRTGIQNNKQYTTWMIDQQDDFSAIVKKSVCEGVHNNYVNPLVLNESSPNMLFADCPLTKGGTGAPVLDSRGKVRAMISKDMDPKVRTYLESTGLLSQSLKTMIHGSNFACAPTPLDNEVLDERECQKDLNYSRVDRARSEMLSTNVLFGELRKQMEESLKDLSRFVQFGVKLIPKGDIQYTEIYPKCFKPLNTWLAEFGGKNTYVNDLPLPSKYFKRSMDAYGRVVGETITEEDKSTYVQFSLKNLRHIKRSSVLMWLPTNSSDVKTFPGISEDCSGQLSLF